MSVVTRLPVQSAIKGLRLHSRQPAAGTPEAGRVTVLLDLGARQAEQDEQLRTAMQFVASMQKAIDALPGTVGARLDEVAALAVELGLAVAREIVGAAIDAGFADPTPTVARCLRDCVHGADRGEITVRMHPDDVEPVRSRLVTMGELDEAVARSRFVADRSVPRGGVTAETDAGRLRYDPRQALERVADEVRREVAPKVAT
jgi:flagellar biosynthesis/type III secretory pathway protein FliH